MCFDVTPPHSLIAYNTTGMLHLRIIQVSCLLVYLQRDFYFLLSIYLKFIRDVCDPGLLLRDLMTLVEMQKLEEVEWGQSHA